MSKQKFDNKELLNSKRIFKSATPKGDISWYIKWMGSILILVAMSMRGVDGMIYTDLLLSITGVTAWLVVGLMWKDRALIILNAVGLSLLINNLINQLI
tara:strand:+ start:11875 stop:12171 length:297 start_codon:yes stop_codon:yes gene_type:complete